MYMYVYRGGIDHMLDVYIYIYMYIYMYVYIYRGGKDVLGFGLYIYIYRGGIDDMFEG